MQSKVFLNIENSTYFIDTFGYRLFFSSQVYLMKFKTKIENYIKDETMKLKNKYRVDINISSYLVLSLYRKIEKRGFRVYLINSKPNKFTRLRLRDIYNE